VYIGIEARERAVYRVSRPSRRFPWKFGSIIIRNDRYRSIVRSGIYSKDDGRVIETPLKYPLKLAERFVAFVGLLLGLVGYSEMAAEVFSRPRTRA